MGVFRDEGQLMPIAAQGVLSRARPPPGPPCQPSTWRPGCSCYLRFRRACDKKCHPSLGNITWRIRISIKSKHMAGCRTEAGGAG